MALLQTHILRTQASKILSEKEGKKWARARFVAAGSALTGISMLGSLLIINYRSLVTRKPDLKIAGWIGVGSVVGSLVIRRMQKKEERISQALVEKYFEGTSIEEVYAAAEYFGMKRSLM